MSALARILVVLATVLVIVVAFVILSPDDEDDGPTAAKTARTPPPSAATSNTTPTAKAAPKQPHYTTIRVRDGKPVGGVKTITVKKNQQAALAIRAPGSSDEIHVHGYDISQDLAGGQARFAFKATLEGVFEIELEKAGAPIAKLVVAPR